VRGNHESCGRAAEGWIRFLDPHHYVWEGAQTCTSNMMYTPPYTVSAGPVNIAVLDASAAADDVDATQVTIYANELALLAKSAPGTWLTQHPPYWATTYGEEDSATMAAAWQKSPLLQLGLVFSGHIHLSEILGFSDNQIPQIVSGNGGTALDPAVKDPTGTALGGRTVSNFYQNDDFGFLAATRNGEGWTFDVRTPGGKTIETCTWAMGAAMKCVSASP